MMSSTLAVSSTAKATSCGFVRLWRRVHDKKGVMRLLFALFVAVVPAWSVAGETLQYEPNFVQISGTVSKGRHEHPNGTWFDVLLLKLNTPASIQGDGEKDSLNVS